MRLTRKQWRIVEQAIVSRFEPGDQHLSKVWHLVGHRGKRAAYEGVDPVDGPARHEIIHALRALVAAGNRLQSKLASDELLDAGVRAEEVLEKCQGALKPE